MFTSKIKIGETYTPSQLADLLNLKSIKTNRFNKSFQGGHLKFVA